MEFSGFFKPYPANRPLTEDERQRQLHQKQRLEVESVYQLSVIRFNTTYMEVVDKWFAWRGVLTSVAAMMFALVVFGVGMWPYLYSTQDQVADGFWWVALAVSIVALIPLSLSVWAFKTDAFRFTHFPIRLNRKTRMVHVFRTNGTVLSVPWSEVFFCIAALPQRNWEIQGHVLDKDGVTVKETFAFMLWGAGERDRDELPRYWEFVRRYMEEGPASVAEIVEYCLPIADQRESFTFGFHRTHGDAGSAPLPIQLFILLIYLVTYPGRWIAMRTSKLPVWPQKIEEACAVDANDPYRKIALTNKPITDHAPIYFVVVVGVALLVAWVGLLR